MSDVTWASYMAKVKELEKQAEIIKVLEDAVEEAAWGCLDFKRTCIKALKKVEEIRGE